MTLALQHFRLDRDRTDRVTVWIDVGGRSMNVLFDEVFDELVQIVEQANQRSQEIPLVFRSGKPKGFVVGADLKRIATIETDAQIQAFLLHGQQALLQLENCVSPTVAILQGPCLGGGLELALACRYRLAVDIESTQLGMPEARLGLMPGWGGTQRLIERVGESEGMAMLLGGESIDAAHSLDIGLVDVLLNESDLESEIERWLTKLNQQSLPTQDCIRQAWPNVCTNAEELSEAQQAILRAIRIGKSESRAAGMQAEREQFFALLKSPVVQANLQRFSGSKPHANE